MRHPGSCPAEPVRIPTARRIRPWWVAWRPNCCTAGPRYHLVCDYCKTTYQRWQAKQAVIVCIYCGEETGGFAAFTPLGKA